MSKPETPCAPECWTKPHGYHDPACPNAPKAEAPPMCSTCGREEAWHKGSMHGFRQAEAPPAPKPDEPLMGVMQPYRQKPAPLANVSEEPMIWAKLSGTSDAVGEWVVKSDAYLALKAQSEAQAQVGIDLVRENDALKAQNAALQEAHDHAQTGLKSARKQEGEMREKIAALTAELERLRDLIVQAREWRFSEADTAWSLVIEARAIHSARAAREAGKA